MEHTVLFIYALAAAIGTNSTGRVVGDHPSVKKHGDFINLPIFEISFPGGAQNFVGEKNHCTISYYFYTRRQSFVFTIASLVRPLLITKIRSTQLTHRRCAAYNRAIE